MENVKAYYAFDEEDDDGSVIFVTEKEYFDSQHAMDEGAAANADTIENVVCDYGYGVLAENMYELDEDEHPEPFDRDEFESFCAERGVTMLFNPAITA